MQQRRWISFAFAGALAFASMGALGCGDSKRGGADAGFGGTDTTGGGDDSGGFVFGDDASGGLMGDVSSDGGGGGGPCTGIACNVQGCSGGGHTTISGTVYAPNGTLPLYNVIVYVPNAPLSPLPDGITCDKCGAVASGSPIAATLSDSKGHFQLVDVPVGTNVPLVVQLGKWRRQITIPTVNACTDNPVSIKDGAKNEPHLPSKRSEGNMPHVAVTTGGCDQLSCMLPKVGIDASEFGTPGSGKAIEFYNGSGGSGPSGVPATTLWNSFTTLSKYDVAIFSCECSEAPDSKDATSYAAVAQYLNAGGRVFTTDFQYTWYKYSPDPGLAAIGNITGGAPPADDFTVNMVTSFPKGKAMADWLQLVAPSSPYGQVTCDVVFNNFQTASPSSVQTWATEHASGAVKPGFMTVNTPVGKPVDMQCGRALHLDAHINNSDSVSSSFPSGCTSPPLDGELAFAFLFFDLSACISSDTAPPPPPPTVH
jgi:hypothetical protein